MSVLLAISSSPRRNGNSELLLQSFNEGVQDGGGKVNSLRISELQFSPCKACDRCATSGECILQDDMQSIYPLIVSAGAMVLATPIYFGSLSAQLKMFIDRFQCWWYAKYRLKEPFVKPEEGKPGFFMSVGALRNKDHAQNALAVARVYFHTINYRYVDSLSCCGLDKKGAIGKQPDALQNAYEAGRSFVLQIKRS